MNSMRTFLVLVALVPTAFAARAAGDIEAGRTKSAVCGACHGADGNSVNAEWPKLAGQGAAYLTAQLQAFRAGHRQNALMSPMAVNLSDADIADLAAWFSTRTPTIGQADPAKDLELAERIWRGGKLADGVPACSACHGPAGAGNVPAAYPALRGQHAPYVAKSLGDYRSGARAVGSAAIMQGIAAGLTDGEIAALANYVQGLH